MAVAAVGLPACNGNHGPQGRTVTVTIEPLRYFTEQIAGNRAKVVTMVPSGGNPETYEPSARQMMELSHSVLYIKVGDIGFERTWMKRLQDNAPHTLVVNASEGVQKLLTPQGHADPHTWMSTANARVIARNIFRAMCRVDAAGSTYYRRNLDKLLSTIERVDQEVWIKVNASRARAFLVYHPVLTYFARDYSLHQLALEEEGREPSAADLQRVIGRARAEGVKTFFVQREFANSNIQVVVDETRTGKALIHPLGYQWDRQMLEVADKLK